MNHIHEVIFTLSYNAQLDFSTFHTSDLLTIKQGFVDVY